MHNCMDLLFPYETRVTVTHAASNVNQCASIPGTRGALSFVESAPCSGSDEVIVKQGVNMQFSLFLNSNDRTYSIMAPTNVTLAEASPIGSLKLVHIPTDLGSPVGLFLRLKCQDTLLAIDTGPVYIGGLKSSVCAENPSSMSKVTPLEYPEQSQTHTLDRESSQRAERVWFSLEFERQMSGEDWARVQKGKAVAHAADLLKGADITGDILLVGQVNQRGAA
jgi:hypothetical protein